MKEWERRVRSEIPAASNEKHYTLLDSLPQFVDELVESLEANYPRLVASRDVANSHARQRANLEDFDLDQVLTEYNVLRRVILDTLDAENVTLTRKERNVLIEFVQYGKQATAIRYAKLAEQRQQEISEALRASEAMHRETFEQAAVGMAHVALDGRWIRVNRKLCEIVGYTQQELGRLRFQDITHPEDLELDLRHAEQLLAGEIGSYHMEKRYFRKDGGVIWIDLTVSLVRDAARKPQYFISVVEDISARKRAEASAEEALATLNSVIESSPLGVAILDRDLRYRRVNEMLAQVNGMPVERIVGKTIDEVLPSDLAPQVSRRLRSVFETGKPILNVETRRIDPVDATERFFLVNFFPIFRDRQVYQAGIKALEITERYKAIEALRQSQEQLRLALEAGRLGTWQVDLKTGVLTRSKECATILGYDVSDTDISESVLREVHPDDRERVQAAWTDAASNHKPFLLEYRLVRPSGEVRWVEVRGETKPDATGSYRYFMGVLADVTIRKRADEERELAARRIHELQQITEAALSRTTTLDNLLDTTLHYLSRTFRAVTAAIQLADGDGNHLEVKAAHGPLTERLNLRIPIDTSIPGRIFMSGQARRVDHLDEVGASDPLLASHNVQSLMAAPLRTKERVIGVAIVGREAGDPYDDDDLTLLQLTADRVSTAIDNAQLYSKLQEKVFELGAEKELREQFVNSLTHDLRNPLAAARVSMQIIQRHPEREDRVQSLAGKAADAISRADRMIQDLLDSSRIRAGRGLLIKPVECDLLEIARYVRDEMTTVHGHRIFLRAPDSEVRGHWDCEELRRAIENLVNNGIKYGDPHAPVTISIEREGDSRIRISVHNFGNPIPPDDQRRMFARFHRGAKTAGTRGWGIGLTLVRGVAEAHGGTVAVESEAHTGTTLSIDIPLDSRPFQKNEG